MSARRLILVVIIAALVTVWFAFDLGAYLNLAYLKEQQAALGVYVTEHPWTSAGAYFLIYVAVTGLSLPGAVPLTLIGGAIFGLLWGTVLISFASTLGATLAFLMSRFVLRDTIQQRFGDKLSAINTGMARDGVFYLFTLRLIPLFPFFLINLLMGLTSLPTRTFFLVSQLGMLPGTLVFTNAGTQLASIDSASGLLSPTLLLSFALLGIFPWLARRLVQAIKTRRALHGYPKPARFDRNLIVIGAGSAGLVTAYIAAALKASVTLIEKSQMGGDCLNTGCVPSKALLRTSRLLAELRHVEDYGLRKASVDFDFAGVMARVRRIITEIAPHDSVERYTSLGVEVLEGKARITSPWHVEINGQTLSTRSIVIASGAGPWVPPIPGIDDCDYLTSDTVWQLQEQPARLAVLGGGAIGCELGQAFARLGSQVTVVEALPQLLGREDHEVATALQARLCAEGVDVRTAHRVVAVKRAATGHVLVCEHDGKPCEIGFDRLLVAVGRRAHTEDLGLEALGIGLTASGTIDVNEYLQTRFPNILACGDVAGPYQFTHAAAHQAWYAAVHALFGNWRRFRVDYSVIPAVTFTEPEIARVGLNETEARQQGIDYEVTRFELSELDRAIIEGATDGFLKVLTVPGKDRILGATIVGAQAGELIGEFVTAMRHRLGLNKILGTLHAYPTLIEANRYAAGAWKRAPAPAGVLRWVARYHSWRRGG